MVKKKVIKKKTAKKVSKKTFKKSPKITSKKVLEKKTRKASKLLLISFLASLISFIFYAFINLNEEMNAFFGFMFILSGSVFLLSIISELVFFLLRISRK